MKQPDDYRPPDRWTDRDWINHLTSALDHCLRFSTIPRYYPEQFQAYRNLIGRARRYLKGS